MLHFVAGRPVGHSRVERIQDAVAAFRAVELGRELERWVVDDRSLVPIGDLLEELSNQRRLAGARVAHQEEVAALLLAANPENLSARPSEQGR